MNDPSAPDLSVNIELRALRRRSTISVSRYILECVLASFLFLAHLVRPFRAESRRRIQAFLAQCGRSLRRPPRETLPVYALHELFPGVETVTLTDAISVEGNVSMAELYALCVAVRASGARRIFEIGTFDGRTSLNMIRNAGPEARLWTLDLPPSELSDLPFALATGEDRFVDKPCSGARFQKRPERSQIEQLLGNSMTFDFSPHHGRCDFVFIDGSHAFEYVMKDSATARCLLGERGVIAWHDYGEWPEVTLALNTLSNDPSNGWMLRRLAGTTLVFAVLCKRENA